MTLYYRMRKWYDRWLVFGNIRGSVLPHAAITIAFSITLNILFEQFIIEKFVDLTALTNTYGFGYFMTTASFILAFTTGICYNRFQEGLNNLYLMSNALGTAASLITAADYIRTEPPPPGLPSPRLSRLGSRNGDAGGVSGRNGSAQRPAAKADRAQEDQAGLRPSAFGGPHGSILEAPPSNESLIWQAEQLHVISLLHAVYIQELFTERIRAPLEILGGMSRWEVNQLGAVQDQPALVLHWLHCGLSYRLSKGTMELPSTILSVLWTQVTLSMQQWQGCQKLARIPLPVSFQQVLAAADIIIVVIVPIVIAAFTPILWLSVLLTFSVIMVYHCSYLAAIRMQQPFGDKYTDLPLLDVHRAFHRRLLTFITPALAAEINRLFDRTKIGPEQPFAPIEFQPAIEAKAFGIPRPKVFARRHISAPEVGVSGAALEARPTVTSVPTAREESIQSAMAYSAPEERRRSTELTALSEVAPSVATQAMEERAAEIPSARESIQARGSVLPFTIVSRRGTTVIGVKETEPVPPSKLPSIAESPAHLALQPPFADEGTYFNGQRLAGEFYIPENLNPELASTEAPRVPYSTELALLEHADTETQTELRIAGDTANGNDRALGRQRSTPQVTFSSPPPAPG